MLLKIVLRCLNGLLFFPQAFYPRCLIASPILDFLKIPHAVWIKKAAAQVEAGGVDGESEHAFGRRSGQGCSSRRAGLRHAVAVGPSWQ